MDSALRLAGHNIAVPLALLNALPQWWQEVATALQLATDEGGAQMAVPFGADDRVMALDEGEEAPAGWWARFSLRRCGEVGVPVGRTATHEGADGLRAGRRCIKVELADVLTGNRYDATLLNLFFAGRLSPDPDDSVEVLQCAGAAPCRVLRRGLGANHCAALQGVEPHHGLISRREYLRLQAAVRLQHAKVEQAVDDTRVHLQCEGNPMFHSVLVYLTVLVFEPFSVYTQP